MRCKQELCPNWFGDGNVCPCALFEIDVPPEDEEMRDGWPVDEEL